MIKEADEEAEPAKEAPTELNNFFYKGLALTLTPAPSVDVKAPSNSVYSGSTLVEMYRKDFTLPQAQSRDPVRRPYPKQSQVR